MMNCSSCSFSSTMAKGMPCKCRASSEDRASLTYSPSKSSLMRRTPEAWSPSVSARRDCSQADAPLGVKLHPRESTSTLLTATSAPGCTSQGGTASVPSGCLNVHASSDGTGSSDQNNVSDRPSMRSMTEAIFSSVLPTAAREASSSSSIFAMRMVGSLSPSPAAAPEVVRLWVDAARVNRRTHASHCKVSFPSDRRGTRFKSNSRNVRPAREDRGYPRKLTTSLKPEGFPDSQKSY